MGDGTTLNCRVSLQLGLGDKTGRHRRWAGSCRALRECLSLRVSTRCRTPPAPAWPLPLGARLSAPLHEGEQWAGSRAAPARGRAPSTALGRSSYPGPLEGS